MIITKVHIKLAEHRMTRKQLHELTGIPKNTITGYANGTFVYVNKEHLNKMCSIFKCSVTDLIEYVDENKD